jgi:hypothetical protein
MEKRASVVVVNFRKDTKPYIQVMGGADSMSGQTLFFHSSMRQRK